MERPKGELLRGTPARDRPPVRDRPPAVKALQELVKALEEEARGLEKLVQGLDRELRKGQSQVRKYLMSTSAYTAAKRERVPPL